MSFRIICILSVGQYLNVRDMAPNLTGIAAIDQEASNGLVQLAIEFAMASLRRDGSFIAKAFLSPHTKVMKGMLEKRFKRVSLVKPDASRKSSAELYLVATNFS